MTQTEVLSTSSLEGKTLTEHEGWQVSGDAAEVYEKCFVPAILADGCRKWLMQQRLPLEIGCSMSAVGLECLPVQPQTASQRKAESWS